MATPKSNKPHGNLKDISGMRFGKLTVIGRSRIQKNKIIWLCICDCGRETEALGINIVRGFTKSCGCGRYKVNPKYKIPEYKAWEAAKYRCNNPNAQEYSNYGGRGIRMCDEWQQSFVAFFEHIGPRPKGMSLNRIDNDGHYEPGNVKWSSNQEQHQNRRNTIRIHYEGTIYSLKELAAKTHVPLGTLQVRFHKHGETGVLRLVRDRALKRSALVERRATTDLPCKNVDED